MSDKVTIARRLVLVVFALLAIVSIAAANGLQAQLHLGRMWTNPENDGAESDAIEFPAGLPKSSQGGGDFTTQDPKRGWVSHGQKSCNYLLSQDWLDPDGVSHDFMISSYFRQGPSAYGKNWSDRPNALWNWVLPITTQEVLRFERPALYTAVAAKSGGDSLTSFVFFPPASGPGTQPWEIRYATPGGTGNRPAQQIDPDLVTEEAILTQWRYIQGLELQRWWYGWGLGTLHQDYVLADTWLVNNGITGRVETLDGQSNPVPIDTLSSQTLTNVIWAPGQDFKDKGMSGIQDGADEEFMYIEPWGAGVHSAMLAWDGDADDATVPGADYGDPGETAYANHLVGNHHTIYGPVFCSVGPDALGTDDVSQPIFRIVTPEKGMDIAGSGYPADAEEQLEWLTDGTYQQPLNTRYQETAANALVQGVSAAQGGTGIMGMGTAAGEVNIANLGAHGWTLGPMDSMRVVMVLASSGLDIETARQIGANWATNKAASPGNPASWMSATDIELFMTGRDSVLKAAALAWYNYHGEFADNVTQPDLNKWGLDFLTPSWTKPAQYGPYDAPDGPRPPEFLAVTRISAATSTIEVRWGTAAESATDHDTNVLDFAGYRVYRWQGSRYSQMVEIAEGAASEFPIAAAKVMNGGTVPAGRTFVDDDVSPGMDYWYAVVAYDDGTQNWEQPGNSLPSTMWWTWSGYKKAGVTAPEPNAIRDLAEPGKFMLEQNAPNPFNPTTSIRFSLAQPGDAKLVIYNTAGQVVRTLVDGHLNSGINAVTWNGRDDVGRQVSSGVYVYRLTSGENQMVRRMVLVR